MDAINVHVEPEVLHIRPGSSGIELKREITEKLSSEHGYVNLDVTGLIHEETERKTKLSIEMQASMHNKQPISSVLIVQMLRKIIYSGKENVTKYILTNFPEVIE